MFNTRAEQAPLPTPRDAAVWVPGNRGTFNAQATHGLIGLRVAMGLRLEGRLLDALLAELILSVVTAQLAASVCV